PSRQRGGLGRAWIPRVWPPCARRTRSAGYDGVSDRERGGRPGALDGATSCEGRWARGGALGVRRDGSRLAPADVHGRSRGRRSRRQGDIDVPGVQRLDMPRAEVRPSGAPREGNRAGRPRATATNWRKEEVTERHGRGLRVRVTHPLAVP